MILKRLTLILCLVGCLLTTHAQDSFQQKHIEVAMRMIGHQLLLSSGDSTSNVLPILKTKDSYTLQFARPFAFYPEDLVGIIHSTMKDSKLTTSYIVEVQKCKTIEVVYSYEMNSYLNQSLIPCKSRMLPEACYQLLFTLNPQKTVAQTVVLSPSENLRNSGGKSIVYILIISSLILLISFFLVQKKKNKPAPNPNLLPLGKYYFDKLNTVLLLDQQKIDLSGKEGDLLLLLYNSANNTVEREVILNTVWGDKGDYIGRTLDVFISKLRKKLQADADIKIVNTRGVGYKLVINK